LASNLAYPYGSWPGPIATVRHHFYLLTAFVGLNLFQSAFTNWCPMMTSLRKLGVRECEEQRGRTAA
jgi:hypothetical protein